MNNNTIFFQPLNEYFDHIYVITLKRATERHRKIEEGLKELQFSFFYGADKKDFFVEELERKGIYNEAKAIAVQRYDKPMSAGQIGCSWSHKMVYEDMLAKGYKKILILEDDVVPNYISMLRFTSIINDLPTNWELVYFDYLKNVDRKLIHRLKQVFYHIGKIFGRSKWSHATISNLYARPYSDRLKIAGYHMYTSAYAINDTAAKKLIELQTPIAFVADHLLAHAISNNIINGFIGAPRLFTQESQTNKAATISYVDD